MKINGPGKYDALCTHVRKKANADGAIVIVIGGDRGPGFSVQVDAPTLLVLPELLEHMAAQIREQMKT